MIRRPLIALALMAGPAAAETRFANETASAGIASVYAGEWEYMVGGGVAAFDCDDNGYPDLLFAGGAGKAAFYRNASTRGGPLRFLPQASGLELDTVTGAYPLDIDSDGITDLVLLRVGENVVMRGLGQCHFARANELWGFEGGDAWSTAFAATWERGAGWPTLAIGNYIDRAAEMEPWGSCTANWLHRPMRPSGFGRPIPLTPSHCALSMLFTDWNRSGLPSLRVSNDREYYEGGSEQMWHVPPGEPPRLYTDAEGWKSLRIWGMGIAASDLDGDGYPEYFLTSMADNKLQKVTGLKKDGRPLPAYNDIAFRSGVTAHRPYAGGDLKPSTAWHAEFGDVNNDGFSDLYVVKGNVAKMPDFAAKDPNNLLLGSAEGKFTEAGESAGALSFRVGRGGLLADLNLDGLLDMVAVNRWESAEVWRNVSTGTGHWLQLRLKQDGPNRDAIGAWLEIRLGARMLRQEVTSGGGHAGGELGWLHVGLGPATEANIRVLWPDGTQGDWQPVKADGFYIVRPGKPPEVWVVE